MKMEKVAKFRGILNSFFFYSFFAFVILGFFGTRVSQ